MYLQITQYSYEETLFGYTKLRGIVLAGVALSIYERENRYKIYPYINLKSSFLDLHNNHSNKMSTEHTSII